MSALYCSRCRARPVHKKTLCKACATQPSSVPTDTERDELISKHIAFVSESDMIQRYDNFAKDELIAKLQQDIHEYGTLHEHELKNLRDFYETQLKNLAECVEQQTKTVEVLSKRLEQPPEVDKLHELENKISAIQIHVTPAAAPPVDLPTELPPPRRSRISSSSSSSASLSTLTPPVSPRELADIQPALRPKTKTQKLRESVLQLKKK